MTMSTFAGRYIKEPSDLSSVASEAKIILAFCDGNQVAAKKFVDLEPAQLAIIQNVGNSLILIAESTVESYARTRGYAIPLYPVDSDVVDLVAQWVWIGALQRGGTLTVVDANKERDAMRKGALSDVADGNLLLTALMAGGDLRPNSNVFSFTDAASRSVTKEVRRNSRNELKRF